MNRDHGSETRHPKLQPGKVERDRLPARLVVGCEARAACGCDLEFAADLGNGRLPPLIETTAFRIIQEALTNSRKYAQTGKLRVSLARRNGLLHIEVRDWGVGFDPSRLPDDRGVGLRSMAERARLLGGDCRIESAPGQGTAVYATLPIND